jgi:hypothetical protein
MEVFAPDAATMEATTEDKVHEQERELARVIEARMLQGYRVESVSEGQAVLVVNGHKRFFGFRKGEPHKTRLTIGGHGRVITRNL